MFEALLNWFAHLDLGLYVLVIYLAGPCLLVYGVYKLVKWKTRYSAKSNLGNKKGV